MLFKDASVSLAIVIKLAPHNSWHTDFSKFSALLESRISRRFDNRSESTIFTKKINAAIDDQGVTNKKQKKER